MLHEHEEGRKHMRAMQAALAGAGASRQRELEEFAAHAYAYVELLRNHIFKEDQRLFPMANQVFSPEDQAHLLEQFGLVEHRDMQQGTHEKYLRLADRLAQRFHVSSTPQTACGCNHGKPPESAPSCAGEEPSGGQVEDEAELGVGD